jgi:hypothetical protein
LLLRRKIVSGHLCIRFDLPVAVKSLFQLTGGRMNKNSVRSCKPTLIFGANSRTCKTCGKRIFGAAVHLLRLDHAQRSFTGHFFFEPFFNTRVVQILKMFNTAPGLAIYFYFAPGYNPKLFESRT